MFYVFTLQLLLQIPEFDNLYLDMNGIIHNCSHPNDEDVHLRIPEKTMFHDIFHYIDFLFKMIKPRKVFFMAIDGVAPRAKMNQVRKKYFAYFYVIIHLTSPSSSSRISEYCCSIQRCVKMNSRVRVRVSLSHHHAVLLHGDDLTYVVGWLPIKLPSFTATIYSVIICSSYFSNEDDDFDQQN